MSCTGGPLDGSGQGRGDDLEGGGHKRSLSLGESPPKRTGMEGAVDVSVLRQLLANQAAMDKRDKEVVLFRMTAQEGDAGGESNGGVPEQAGRRPPERRGQRCFQTAVVTVAYAGLRRLGEGNEAPDHTA